NALVVRFHHERWDLCQPGLPGRDQPPLAGDHLETPSHGSHADRLQNATFADALDELTQPCRISRLPWLRRTAIDAIQRNPSELEIRVIEIVQSVVGAHPQMAPFPLSRQPRERLLAAHSHRLLSLPSHLPSPAGASAGVR